MYNLDFFDVIVIGGGHAALEASHASAKMGAKTLMITSNLDHIGQMSCNPSIGGVAKGNVVREIDAMGGLMGKVAESAMIWFKVLNHSKGPAVWSPRAQCDRIIYQKAIKNEIENTENLYIKQSIVDGFIIENNKVQGIITQFDERILTKSIIICAGTFLSGKLHYGMKSFNGGRSGDVMSSLLSYNLSDQLGLDIGILKTGTPPRVLGKTVNFSKISTQPNEKNEENFTFFDEKLYPRTNNRDLSCYITKTNQKTIDLIKDNIDKTPLYNGKIIGIGTRYCPSLEDKVMRFTDREEHTIYLEPEGEYTNEYYVNGFSTSLPPNIQSQIINTVTGMENAVISRYAYAIEYNFVLPYQIRANMSLKKWDNVFLAGQINGTSGYEEAAGQGLVAGINAARYASNNSIFEMSRDLSYIGVMIDDIVSKDIIEPYRLFTSRSEYRIHLRQDCADIRLCSMAYNLGLLSFKQYDIYNKYLSVFKESFDLSFKVKYQGRKISDILREYRGIYNENLDFPSELIGIDITNKMHRRALKQIMIKVHYDGYLKKEIDEIKRLKSMDSVLIPSNFNYDIVKGLSNEARDKLKRFTPSNFKEASRIDGVAPVELTILRIFLKKFNN